MNLDITSHEDVKRKDTLEDSGGRKWKVIKRHPSWPVSWILKSGPVTRLVFPIDLNNYSILLEEK
jgi:hypothetical protein